MAKFTIIKAESAPRVVKSAHRCDCFCEHDNVTIREPKQRKVSLPAVAVVTKARRKAATKG